jgi:hypothetical protein
VGWAGRRRDSSSKLQHQRRVACIRYSRDAFFHQCIVCCCGEIPVGTNLLLGMVFVSLCCFSTHLLIVAPGTHCCTVRRLYTLKVTYGRGTTIPHLDGLFRLQGPLYLTSRTDYDVTPPEVLAPQRSRGTVHCTRCVGHHAADAAICI